MSLRTIFVVVGIIASVHAEGKDASPYTGGTSAAVIEDSLIEVDSEEAPFDR